jgi:hypothetical protein
MWGTGVSSENHATEGQISVKKKKLMKSHSMNTEWWERGQGKEQQKMPPEHLYSSKRGFA